MHSISIARIATIAATLGVAAVVSYQCSRKTPVPPVDVVDEIAATQHLLEDKFSGPRYFVLPDVHSHEEGGPWIGQTEALDQVDRVVAERKLGTEAAAKVRLLIEELAEPHPSRDVGGWPINLMRHNLRRYAIRCR